MLGIEELDQTVANEESNAAEGYLKKQHTYSQCLFVGGASESQQEVDDGEVIDADLALLAGSLCGH